MECSGVSRGGAGDLRKLYPVGMYQCVGGSGCGCAWRQDRCVVVVVEGGGGGGGEVKGEDRNQTTR